jgi:hypothetical protein
MTEDLNAVGYEIERNEQVRGAKQQDKFGQEARAPVHEALSQNAEFNGDCPSEYATANGLSCQPQCVLLEPAHIPSNGWTDRWPHRTSFSGLLQFNLPRIPSTATP